MKTRGKGRSALWAVLAIALGACDMVQVYDGQIRRATRAIETARNDAQRAAAYADRGRGYSDKARYLMFRKTITRDAYLRMFELAVDDHDRAVALDPVSAEVYFKRGLSDYDRAAQVPDLELDHTPWFDAARADFAKTASMDPKHELAYDYLGLVDEQTGRIEDAIADYTREMALDPRLGRSRLAELYCNRGQSLLKEKNYDPAATNLEASVRMGGDADGCSCEPYNALAFIYIDVTRDYDKGWELVHRAQGSRNFIAPEYIEKLKKASGRAG